MECAEGPGWAKQKPNENSKPNAFFEKCDLMVIDCVLETSLHIKSLHQDWSLYYSWTAKVQRGLVTCLGYIHSRWVVSQDSNPVRLSPEFLYFLKGLGERRLKRVFVVSFWQVQKVAKIMYNSGKCRFSSHSVNLRKTGANERHCLRYLVNGRLCSFPIWELRVWLLFGVSSMLCTFCSLL